MTLFSDKSVFKIGQPYGIDGFAFLLVRGIPPKTPKSRAKSRTKATSKSTARCYAHCVKFSRRRHCKIHTDARTHKKDHIVQR